MSTQKKLAERVFPGPLSTNFYDGHYYGLPLDTNTRIFFWNQYLYAEAGLEAPPATMDELAAQCEAVTAMGDEYYIFSDGGTYGWAILPWIWSFGGDITDAEITMASGYLNSEGTVAAFEWLTFATDAFRMPLSPFLKRLSKGMGRYDVFPSRRLARLLAFLGL